MAEQSNGSPRLRQLGWWLALGVSACWCVAYTPAVFAFYTTVQNDYYVVNVVDDSVSFDSIGGFQVHTGFSHPAGAGKDITYNSAGSVNIGTSFSGIRIQGDNANVYTSDSHGAGTVDTVNNLDTYFSFEGPTPGYIGAGWRTMWDLFPEQLEIVQDVIVGGDEFDQAAVYHTVEIINGRNAQVELEWLNLLDFDTATDGGPKNSVERASGGVLVDNPNEYSHGPLFADELIRVSDYPMPGGYYAFWSLTFDPGFRPELDGEPLVATAPEEFQYVAWATAYDPANFLRENNVFDYAVDTSLDVATSLDSAGIARFQATVPQDGSVRFTQVIWAQPVPEPATLSLLASGLMGLAVLVWRRRPFADRCVGS